MNTDLQNPTPADGYLSDPDACLDMDQVPAGLQDQALAEGNRPASLLVYGLFGMYLGVLFIKSEVVSWFRIQEMFRFDSFHMYGIIGSAVLVGIVSLQLIKRMDLKTRHGEPIRISPKAWSGWGTRYWLGGTLFGFGWALLGACPGPIFALLGSGVTVIFVALVSALAGTWVYAALRPHLPH